MMVIALWRTRALIKEATPCFR